MHGVSGQERRFDKGGAVLCQAWQADADAAMLRWCVLL